MFNRFLITRVCLVVVLCCTSFQTSFQGQEIPARAEGTSGPAVPKKASAKPKQPRRMLVTNLSMRDGKPVRGSPLPPFRRATTRSNRWERGRARTRSSSATTSRCSARNDRPVRRHLLLQLARCAVRRSAVEEVAARFRRQRERNRRDSRRPGDVRPVAAVRPVARVRPDARRHRERRASVGRRDVDQGRRSGQSDHGHVRWGDVPDPRSGIPAAGALVARPSARAAEHRREPDGCGRRPFFKTRVEDKDFPMSWIKPHGKGRVFFSGFGHSDYTFWNPQMLEHILAGIQYALGDLAADDAPGSRRARFLSSGDVMSFTPSNKRAVLSTLVVVASTCAVLLSGQGQSAPQGPKVTIVRMYLQPGRLRGRTVNP